MDAIAQVQRPLLGGRRKGRSFAPRSLALVPFIEARTGGPVRDFAPGLAPRLWREWETEHPEWAFHEAKELVRAYKRAREAFSTDDRATWRQMRDALTAATAPAPRPGRRSRR